MAAKAKPVTKIVTRTLIELPYEDGENIEPYYDDAVSNGGNVIIAETTDDKIVFSTACGTKVVFSKVALSELVKML